MSEDKEMTWGEACDRLQAGLFVRRDAWIPGQWMLVAEDGEALQIIPSAGRSSLPTLSWADMKATDWRATDNPDVVTNYNGKLLARAIASGHDVYFRLPGSLDSGEIRFGTPDLEWEYKTVHMAVRRSIES